MKYYLFLDDERHLHNVTWIKLPSQDNRWETVRSYDEFVQRVSVLGVPEFVSFDHDLADEHYVAMLKEVAGTEHNYGSEKTGYDCAIWLVDFCCFFGLKFPEYTVHSMNPIGAERICGYIENAKKHLGI